MLDTPLKIAGRVEDVKLKVSNIPRWRMLLRHFDGKNVLITLEQLQEKRTIDQNSLYWLYLRVIADEVAGDDQQYKPENLHAFFKHKFIPTKLVTVFGETVSADKSTTKLNKKEFSDYLKHIEELTGVPIPDTENFKISD